MPASGDSLSEQPERSYHPSTFIRGSAALHAAAVVALIGRAQLWPWALSAVVANHLALTAAGLWPRAALLGPNRTRLPPAAAARREIAITIDDGPDGAVTPRVLDILDAHRARATFFCLGERVLAHPALAREIVARGQEIGNHSYRHLKRFSVLGPRALADEVLRTQQAVAAVTGVSPRFFRAPFGFRSPLLEPVLARSGLQLVSWTRRGFDTVNGSAAQVLRRLTRGLGSGDIMLLHDGHAAQNSAGVPVILEVLPPLLCALRESHLATVTLSQALAAPGCGPLAAGAA
jgi:peptidoglycan-N-acetylglucosamine deacetylase